MTIQSLETLFRKPAVSAINCRVTWKCNLLREVTLEDYDLITRNDRFSNNNLSNWISLNLSPSPGLTIVIYSVATSVGAKIYTNTAGQPEDRKKRFRILDGKTISTSVFDAISTLNQHICIAFTAFTAFIAITPPGKA